VPCNLRCTAYFGSMPVVIFGGLVSATLLDTLLTPVLFLKLGRKPVERLAASRWRSLRPAEAF